MKRHAPVTIATGRLVTMPTGPNASSRRQFWGPERSSLGETARFRLRVGVSPMYVDV